MTPSYWKQATRELTERDAVLKKLVGSFRGLALHSRGDAFHTLARSIVGQQISVKAAESVWQRLNQSVDAITPQAIISADNETLKTCGLSSKKALYLQDLASHFLNGALDVNGWSRLDDEALIAELTKVKGIGRWTAEMFLIFYMTRPDVLPLDDIGLQRAMSIHYNDHKPLSKLKMRSIARQWQPWRSVATWYMWRSLDPLPVEY